MSALDKKDARLATLLQADGRVSNARLAEQLHPAQRSHDGRVRAHYPGQLSGTELLGL
ncbi:AsnC family transcriptional regulator [Vreelandella sp. 21]|uniref:AsnC family transcriptional regulator n=1 Tax=Halomonadaceae TaxID=28256 RepID=UPI000A9E89ED|nr:Lrp/AsnC family transcriptional regulator [Halomonas sp. IOP_6]MCD6004956.1 Lrp/AsnC family transcriptional regulator [Halomonas sp. IOP_6]